MPLDTTAPLYKRWRLLSSFCASDEVRWNAAIADLNTTEGKATARAYPHFYSNTSNSSETVDLTAIRDLVHRKMATGLELRMANSFACSDLGVPTIKFCVPGSGDLSHKALPKALHFVAELSFGGSFDWNGVKCTKVSLDELDGIVFIAPEERINDNRN